MLTKNQIESFRHKGFLKFKYPDIELLKNLKNEFAEQIKISLRKKIPEFYKKISIMKNNTDIILNDGMLKLEKINHENLVEIYNSLPRSISFYQVISNQNLISIVNKLLGNPKHRNLYINSNSVRMDTPGPNKFMYGWHQDYKSNIEGSNFLQLWMPVVGHIDEKIGGLHVMEGSFKYDIKTTHTKVENKRKKINAPIRASYDTKILDLVKNFKETHLTCRFGEGIIFNSMLMHKSGLNKTRNKMRYAMTCFYHDILNPSWSFKVLDHKKMKLKY